MSRRDDLIRQLEVLTAFPEVLATLYHARYTGTLTLHFYAGVPQTVELPGPPPIPVKIPLGPRAREVRPSPPAPVRDAVPDPVSAPAPNAAHATGD